MRTPCRQSTSQALVMTHPIGAFVPRLRGLHFRPCQGVPLKVSRLPSPRRRIFPALPQAPIRELSLSQVKTTPTRRTRFLSRSLFRLRRPPLGTPPQRPLVHRQLYQRVWHGMASGKMFSGIMCITGRSRRTCEVPAHIRKVPTTRSHRLRMPRHPPLPFPVYRPRRRIISRSAHSTVRLKVSAPTKLPRQCGSALWPVHAAQPNAHSTNRQQAETIPPA